MSKYFALNDIGTKAQAADPSKLLVEKFLTVHERRIVSIKDLSGRLPDEKEIFFLWTLSSFNAFTFIPYIIKECGNIDRLTLSTYSINSRIVDSLMRYIDKGKINHAHILISDSLRSRMPHVVDHLSSLVSTRRNVISVALGWNHSKITLMETAGKYFVVEGSGNWSENSRNEQYVFLNSKQVYEFRNRCIREAVN